MTPQGPLHIKKLQTLLTTEDLTYYFSYLLWAEISVFSFLNVSQRAFDLKYTFLISTSVEKKANLLRNTIQTDSGRLIDGLALFETS